MTLETNFLGFCAALRAAQNPNWQSTGSVLVIENFSQIQ